MDEMLVEKFRRIVIDDLKRECDEWKSRAEAAERELAELRAANEWRPVTEKPERWSWRGGFIVATEAEEVYYVDEYDKGTWWRGDGYMKECKFVTHWRRLPPPPNIIQE